ncbi:hypothetical protein [Fundidesulfovibrio putealis]|uniref:hypothetical protein n=1 Tax=Fundidesulfovibrio putealis TaxID=270496 RepID=UPI000423094E|nr:hypothetical protein [Fundidesulfovibrio putealis]
MKLGLFTVFFLMLLTTSAAARPVNDFTVKDGQGSYPFALSDTEMKLFFYNSQRQDFGDMRSKVFSYKPIGPAPLDSALAREEIAKMVKWLFFNETARVDAARPMELPGGIICYPVVMIADGSGMDGLGLRITVESGAIRMVEVAACMTCGVMGSLIKDYEGRK